MSYDIVLRLFPYSLCGCKNAWEELEPPTLHESCGCGKLTSAMFLMSHDLFPGVFKAILSEL